MMVNKFINICVPVIWIMAFASALMIFEDYEAQSFGLSFILFCAAALISIVNNPAFMVVQTNLQNPALLALGLAFWLLALISTILSAAPYVSFIYFCFFSSMPLSFLIYMIAPDKERFLKIAGAGLAVIFLLLSLAAFAQYLFFPDLLHNGFVNRPLANPNSFAGLLSLGFFGAMGWLLIAKNRIYSGMALALCLLILMTVFMTGSKGALFALLGSLTVFIILTWAQIKKYRWRCLTLFFLSAGLFLAFNLQTPHRIIGAITGQTSILSSRPEIWASTWEIIRDHFWIGTGTGTFFLYYPEYRGGDLGTAGLMVHNDPLQFWSEMGIFAPVLFYAFIVLAIIKTFKALANIDHDDTRRIKIIAPFCGFGAMIAHTHFTFHFNVLSILTLSGLMLGFWFGKIDEAASSPALPLRKFAGAEALKAVTLLALFAALLLFIMLQGSEILTDRAKERMLAGDFQGFVQNINLAGKLSHDKNARAFVLAASVPMSVLEINDTELPAGEREKSLAQAYGLLEKAEKLNPRLVSVPYYKAQIIENSGTGLHYESDSKALLNKALQIDPSYLGARVMLAEIYVNEGNKNQALGILKAGIKWPYMQQNPSAYYRMMVLLALELGDLHTHELAIKKMFAYKKKHGRK